VLEGSLYVLSSNGTRNSVYNLSISGILQPGLEELLMLDPRYSSKIFLFLMISVLISGSAAVADETTECIEAKATAVGKAISCQITEANIAKCDHQLDRRIRRAERKFKHQCPQSPDAKSLGEWAHSLSERVFESVDGRQTPTDFDYYMAHRGPNDPDPRDHMRDLVEYTRQNRAAAVRFCSEQNTSVPAAQCPGGVPFCAFVVNRETDSVVARACNHGAANPIFHGEIAVINAVANTFQAQGMPFSSVAANHDLYTTGESCAMCAGAIMWSGLKTVFFGSTVATLSNYYSQIQISHQELSGLWTECQEQDDLTVKTRVVGPVLEAENDALFAEFGFQFCSGV